MPKPEAKRRLVIIESPYAGMIERNVAYARAAMRDCLLRGESPMASHLLYTQDGVLKDEIPAEREIGMRAGWEWFRVSEAVVVYTDLGISSGMKGGMTRAAKAGLPVEERSLPEWQTKA